MLTINTMGAATEVIVPLQSHYFSVAGLGQLLETIRLMQSWVNPDLKISGVLECPAIGRGKAGWWGAWGDGQADTGPAMIEVQPLKDRLEEPRVRRPIMPD